MFRTSHRSTLQYREQEMTASQVAAAKIHTKMLFDFPMPPCEELHNSPFRNREVNSDWS